MRRISAAELMLLATVTIWAFNFTVTWYALTHGFQPLGRGAAGGRRARRGVIADRVSQLLGRQVVSLHTIESRGYGAIHACLPRRRRGQSADPGHLGPQPRAVAATNSI